MGICSSTVAEKSRSIFSRDILIRDPNGDSDTSRRRTKLNFDWMRQRRGLHLMTFKNTLVGFEMSL